MTGGAASHPHPGGNGGVAWVKGVADSFAPAAVFLFRARPDDAEATAKQRTAEPFARIERTLSSPLCLLPGIGFPILGQNGAMA